MDLPALTASLNLVATILLLAGYRAIKQGKTILHARIMHMAFVASALFLISYLTHHFTSPELSVKYAGPNAWKFPYLALLLAHTVLAAAVPFLAIRTILLGRKAINGDKLAADKHRTLAKITFPIWLFVSISGVLIYLILYQLTDSWEQALQSINR